MLRVSRIILISSTPTPYRGGREFRGLEPTQRREFGRFREGRLDRFGTYPEKGIQRIGTCPEKGIEKEDSGKPKP